MATATLSSVADIFPVGTSVAAYPVSGWPGSLVGNPTGAPVGSSTDTATVASSGSLEFDGLDTEARYFAYAQVGSEHRYRAFSTRRDSRPVTSRDIREVVVLSQAEYDALTPDAETDYRIVG